MRNVVASPSVLVRGNAMGDPEWHAHVHDTAQAATAWIQTFLDCEAVQLFRFEPEADPLGDGQRMAAVVEEDKAIHRRHVSAHPPSLIPWPSLTTTL